MKRAEILQLLLQNPDFMMFDEPDSGVDVENVELIGKMMSEMLQRDKKPSERKKSALIITHTGFISPISYGKRGGKVLSRISS